MDRRRLFVLACFQWSMPRQLAALKHRLSAVKSVNYYIVKTVSDGNPVNGVVTQKNKAKDYGGKYRVKESKGAFVDMAD